MCIRIKVCGVTDAETARTVSALGVDAAGFVFAASPRQVTAAIAGSLSRHLSSNILKVAVFRHPTRQQLDDVLRNFQPDTIQCEPNAQIRERLPEGCSWLPVFHDNEDVVEQVAEWRRKNNFPGPVLLEPAGQGGRGRRPNWDRAAKLSRDGPIALAGGLSAINVASAIRAIKPDWVDASSSLESAPGTKSSARIIEFVSEVRRAVAELNR